jgi:hypothetical protein
LGDQRILCPPFSLIFALLIGGALPRGDLIEGVPIRVHPDVEVSREHGA